MRADRKLQLPNSREAKGVTSASELGPLKVRRAKWADL